MWLVIAKRYENSNQEIIARYSSQESAVAYQSGWNEGCHRKFYATVIYVGDE